ncbi:hypothetical protein CLIB1423_10S00958 [[Candida] railenensis]|uniref:Uncharacterized protein n=1 Tax=[Candida] railenensis TaxID=45579 RepID=A0A9P0QRD7_9ASCO|nr:hypothetical protein CLIB1423_10S00958 [[Candida] railenensis]
MEHWQVTMHYLYKGMLERVFYFYMREDYFPLNQETLLRFVQIMLTQKILKSSVPHPKNTYPHRLKITTYSKSDNAYMSLECIWDPCYLGKPKRLKIRLMRLKVESVSVPSNVPRSCGIRYITYFFIL